MEFPPHPKSNILTWKNVMQSWKKKQLNTARLPSSLFLLSVINRLLSFTMI